MVGGFFPTPYPDESYYSVLCRYYVRSGSTSHVRTRNELFENDQCLSTAVFFPARLDCIERWIPSGAITRREFTANHTMFHYMVVSYSGKLREAMNDIFKGIKPEVNVDIMGRQKSWRLWSEYLRYCPECVADDILLYGETYWHRIHQLPGVVYCTKHKSLLVDSEVLTRDTTMRFYPASHETHLRSDTANIYFELYKDKFMKIADENQWLLNHGMAVDWNYDFQAKYKRLLREKDIVTVQGVADYDLIIKQFNDYWGSDFLELLYSVTFDKREWIRQINATFIQSFKPLYHILLMCFLKDTVKAFVECNPSENPFGGYLRMCENPICSHYRSDCCQNTEVRYVNGIATGFFKCEKCGMIYKQTKRKGKTGDVIIVDYGHIWKRKLENCLKNKMTIGEIAEILKCKPHAVNFQRKKLGLHKIQEYVRNTLRKVDTENYYKAQVLNLCEQYDELTLALLNEHAPGAYSYFSKHDFEWLRSRIVYDVDSKHHQQYDKELLEKVKVAVKQIKSGDNKRQLTRAYIASVAGVKEGDLYLSTIKRPQTSTFLKSVIESRKEWLRRRISAIGQQQKQHGKPLVLADVKREMSLKPNTYVKYKNFIEDLITELNGTSE